MATLYSPRIVTDGLIFALDSGNVKSYSGTGTTLKDLTGNTNLTTEGTYNFTSGNFTFPNSVNSFNASAWARSSTNDQRYILDLNRGSSGFVCFKNTSLLADEAQSWHRQVVFGWGFDSALGGWHIARYKQSTNFIFSYKFDQEPTFGTTTSLGTVEIDKWTILGFTQNSSQLRLFNNGQHTGTVNISSKTLTGTISTAAALAIGAMANVSSTPIYGYIGEIGFATFYEKALTDDEVLQNFKAIKNRFGI